MELVYRKFQFTGLPNTRGRRVVGTGDVGGGDACPGATFSLSILHVCNAIALVRGVVGDGLQIVT